MSKYFKTTEMACKCGKCDGGAMDPEFMRLLDRIRESVARPLRITSGFRCPDHNKRVGGVPSSLHLLGRAADIMAPLGALKYDIVLAAQSVGIGGIGVAKGYIHVDNRDVKTPSLWTY